MNIESRHLDIIKAILAKYPYIFYAFGSRVTGNNKQFSDLDLCFFDKIPNNIILKIEEEFENSDLPYKVDLVDANTCDQEFLNIIKNNLFCLQKFPT